MNLSVKVMIGMGVGVVLGLIFKGDVIVVKPIADLFLNALKLIVVPVVVTSLVGAIAQHDPTKSMGKLASRTLIVFVVFSSVAIGMGIAVATFLKPGVAIGLTPPTAVVSHAVSLKEQWVAIIPQNFLGALSGGNMMQIVLVSVLLGLAIRFSGDKVVRIKELVKEGSYIIDQLIRVVFWFSPIGIGALMAVSVGEQGVQVLGALGKVCACVGLSCLLIAFVFFTMILLALRKNIVSFWKQISPALLLAFSTTSAAATLPVSIRVVEDSLQVPSSISRFVLPLGAVLNKGGTAMYQAIAAVFIAQLYNVSLGIEQLALLGLTILILSFGTPSIPSAGLLILSVILTTMGLPLEGVALIAGIDRILDMMRTPLNIAGDCVASLVIAKWNPM